jgi:hypothetical protein
MEARKFLEYFVWKITILHQKIIFFPILGGHPPGAPPPWIRPWFSYYICTDEYNSHFESENGHKPANDQSSFFPQNLVYDPELTTLVHQCVIIVGY